MPKNFPGTLLEFEHWFRTEEACRDYLAGLRWPDGFCCPRCGHRQAWKTARGLWHCGGCRKDISVTVGTVLQGSHLPLRVWFRVAWLMTNQKSGLSALGLQQNLGLGSYRTAWACLHKLRAVMIRSGREQLSGAVEVDETLVGGYARRGSGKKKAVVAIAAEVRGERVGRIRLKHIPDATANSVLGFVREFVVPGSTVRTDGLGAYVSLMGMGYEYRPAVARDDPADASKKFLPRVHRVASLLKRWLLGSHHGKFARKNLQRYLDEYTFRFNRRTSPKRGMLFFRLLQQVVITEKAPR